jgi:hypothetical protein
MQPPGRKVSCLLLAQRWTSRPGKDLPQCADWDIIPKIQGGGGQEGRYKIQEQYHLR